MNSSELVRQTHLTRQAIIYVRQSTMKQAIANRESLEMQYALRARAQECGWPDDSICVIDQDIGASGSTTEGREGFKELVNRVSLGQAGAIFAFDVTRLARNCSDWYQLLDLCGFRQCLIGDADSICDPGSINGRLLLGLKGQISELELHTIRSRLNAGMLNKARRGELVVDLPIGFLKGEEAGSIEKHPDKEVQSRIALVFRLFLRLKSLGKVVRYLNEQELLFPRRIKGGADVRWREPSLSAISSMIRNPTYAGAYAYGKTRFVPQTSAPHKRRKQRIDRNQWKVLIEDHHPGYVTWEEFMKIQEILENNHAEYGRKQSSGVARAGSALLQGIVYCGRCGHQMTIQYRPHAKYTCNFLYQQRRTAVCALIRADSIDSAVEEIFWTAFNADELNLLDEAEHRISEEAEELAKARQQQLQRLKHQADLAERQYQHCDPANRLVAAELEARWEAALRAMREEEDRQQREPCPSVRRRLTQQQRHAWNAAGTSLRDMWDDKRMSFQQKKRVLRALIQKVVIQIAKPGTASIRVVWRGGHVDTKNVQLKVASLESLPEGRELERRIVAMAKEGLPDEWIAHQLSKEGYRQPHSFHVSIGLVGRVRQRNRILRPTDRRQTSSGFLSLSQVKRRTGIPVDRIFDLIVDGRLPLKPDECTHRFLIPDTEEMLAEIRKVSTEQRKRQCAQQGAST